MLLTGRVRAFLSIALILLGAVTATANAAGGALDFVVSVPLNAVYGEMKLAVGRYMASVETSTRPNCRLTLTPFEVSSQPVPPDSEISIPAWCTTENRALSGPKISVLDGGDVIILIFQTPISGTGRSEVVVAKLYAESKGD